MQNILVVNYSSRMAKAFATEKAAKQYANDKVELWPNDEIAILGFVDERSLADWTKQKLVDEWVVIR